MSQKHAATPEQRAEIVRLCLGGMTARAAVRAVGFKSRNICTDALREAGINIRWDRQTPTTPYSVRQIPQHLRPEIVRLYQDEQLSLKQVAARFGCPWEVCRNIVRKAGVMRGNQEAKRLASSPIKEDYFASIETETQAYLLGLISADGCVGRVAGTDRLRGVKLSLHEKDGYMVRRFAAELGVEASLRISTRQSRPPGKKTDHYCTQVAAQADSVRIAADLVALGVVPNKSLILRPWAGPNHLMRHYWRGFVDGDGTIMCKPGKRQQQTSVSLIGTQWVVDSFARWVSEITGYPYKKPVPRNTYWTYRVSYFLYAKRLCQELYGDASICLRRKKERADAMIAYIPKKDRPKG